MEDLQENVDKMKADEAETDAPVTGQPCSLEWASGPCVLVLLSYVVDDVSELFLHFLLF